MTPPPLPPANPDEHQYWTDPILCEETRTRLEHFRNLGWLPPNYKPRTLEGLAVVEQYCAHSNEDYVEYLLSEDKAIYMNFLDWMSRTSREKRLQTYDEYWRRLCQYFGLFARRPVNHHVHEQIQQYLEQVFPAEHKINRRVKKKSTLDIDDFCVLLRHHWVHSSFFRHGSMIIQQAVIMLWSSITGTWPGVLLPQRDATNDPNASQDGSLSLSPRKRKRGDSFKSDLPQRISPDDLPNTICYRDIELFYLRNPDDGRDVLCAIIEFRNLKGRPEGADGMKFFMHGDYQLAYCPIVQIVSLAFRDDAFENELTPELIWRIKVPKRTRALPLRWKKDKLNLPLLRRVVRTQYGYGVHPTLPMTYDSSRLALKDLGEDGGFEDNLGHYNFRRWTANEANRHFTSQERKRVLGQSRDFIFEKHYQAEFIQRDLQHVVLLWPPQEGLLQRAAGMLRNRDPLAPSNITDEQLRAIRRHPEILELRREKRELKEEMRSLAGTIQNTRNHFPDLYQRHDEISRKLTKLRKALQDNTQQTARKDYFHTAPVLEIDRQIQQLLGKSGAENCDDDSTKDGDEDWQPPIPDYIFPERARLVESFYGPEGECFDEDRLLAKCIQVTEDLVTLSHLCEPNRRGKRANWDGDDEQSKTSGGKEAFLSEEKSPECPTDVCIICCGISRHSPSNPHPHKFPSQRKDSLHHYLISHLMNAHDGVHCTWETCSKLPTFIDIAEFLAHAANIHHYDLHIKLEHIPKRRKPSRDETPSFSSSSMSLRSSRSATETPASSVGIEIGKIDPRLLAASNTKYNETCRRSQRLNPH
ncbi:hypothetical protein SI65_05738 [Aspergillus cristatus]|uniref:FluG domain-containing protein n=1 Tax=Aspergillus cristatus TaxID=573508 RepID=A0A1E3BED3_ASPCR|nr:hypothetical protein SI65_05738 [Aspergillus cristatus]